MSKAKTPERTMLEVEVYASENGQVCIKQPQYGHDDAIVIVHPSQIDLLIQWLKEVKEELQGQ